MNALKYIEPIGSEFSPVSAEEIEYIEARLARKLPQDYVDFIKRYGRCGFSGDAMVGPSVLYSIFGGGVDSGSLLKAVDAYDDLTVDGKLVIADDMAGNPYVLDPATGSVNFIEFTAAGARACHVAASFSDFLSRIEVKSY